MKSKPEAKPKSKAAETHVVFVYGTLKEGFYNNDYWFKDATKIGVDAIGGYVMLNLGPYPAIVKIESPLTTDLFGVTGELWEVPHEAYVGVKAMEEGAGYKAVQVTTDNGIRVEVFVMHIFPEGNYSWVKGDAKGDKVQVASRDAIPF